MLILVVETVLVANTVVVDMEIDTFVETDVAVTVRVTVAVHDEAVVAEPVVVALVVVLVVEVPSLEALFRDLIFSLAAEPDVVKSPEAQFPLSLAPSTNAEEVSGRSAIDQIIQPILLVSKKSIQLSNSVTLTVPVPLDSDKEPTVASNVMPLYITF